MFGGFLFCFCFLLRSRKKEKNHSGTVPVVRKVRDSGFERVHTLPCNFHALPPACSRADDSFDFFCIRFYCSEPLGSRFALRRNVPHRAALRGSPSCVPVSFSGRGKGGSLAPRDSAQGLERWGRPASPPNPTGTHRANLTGVLAKSGEERRPGGTQAGGWG